MTGADRPPAGLMTKREKPVAAGAADEEIPTIFGGMRGTVKLHGDILGPTGDEWNAPNGMLTWEMRTESAALLLDTAVSR